MTDDQKLRMRCVTEARYAVQHNDPDQIMNLAQRFYDFATGADHAARVGEASAALRKARFAEVNAVNKEWMSR